MQVVNIFLTAILLIGMVPMAAFAETTDSYYTFALISQPVEYYGRTALGNLANAAALLLRQKPLWYLTVQTN